MRSSGTGIRAIVAVTDDGAQVWSRHGTVLTRSFLELTGLTDHLRVGTVLDGELVVCDEEGRPDFRRIRRRMLATKDNRVRAGARCDPATLVVFNLLRDGGHDITQFGWSARRSLPENAVPPHGSGWVINSVYEDGPAMCAATSDHGLEGVVAKRVDAPYRPGKRSEAWVKVKHLARTALPVVGVRDDAILVGDADDHRPIAWVDRFHPAADRSLLRVGPRVPSGEVVGLCVVEHLATESGGLREALVLAVRPWGRSVTVPGRGTGEVA